MAVSPHPRSHARTLAAGAILLLWAAAVPAPVRADAPSAPTLVETLRYDPESPAAKLILDRLGSLRERGWKSLARLTAEFADDGSGLGLAAARALDDQGSVPSSQKMPPEQRRVSEWKPVRKPTPEYSAEPARVAGQHLRYRAQGLFWEHSRPLRQLARRMRRTLSLVVYRLRVFLGTSLPPRVVTSSASTPAAPVAHPAITVVPTNTNASDAVTRFLEGQTESSKILDGEAPADTDFVFSAEGNLDQLPPTHLEAMLLAAAAEAPENANLDSFRDVDSRVGFLRKCIEVSIGKNDDIINVAAELPNANDAAQLVNSVVDSYVTQYAEHRRSNTVEVLNILRSEKQRRDTELE